MACPVPECSQPGYEQDLEPDPDISGTGVLVGFLGTAYITFVLVVWRYIDAFPLHALTHKDINPVDRLVLGWVRKINTCPRSSEWDSTLRSAVLLMSDQQLVTGIAILIGGYSQLQCAISLFHWSIVVQLAWFSSMTHLSALTYIQTYLRDDKKGLYLRLPLMLVLVGLLVVALVPTKGAGYALPDHPAVCLFGVTDINKSWFTFDDKVGPVSPTGAMIISQVMLVMMFLSRVIKCHKLSSLVARKWLRTKPSTLWSAMVRSFGRMADGCRGWIQRAATLLYVLSLALHLGAEMIADLTSSLIWDLIWLSLSLIWGTLRLHETRKNVQETPAILEDNFWSFGQLVPVLLLLIPLLNIAATWLDRNRKFRGPEVRPLGSGVTTSSQPDLEMDSTRADLLGRHSRRSSFELQEARGQHRSESTMILSDPNVAFSGEQRLPNPCLVSADTLDDVSSYEEPWIQDNVLFTTLLFLVNATVILICGNGPAAVNLFLFFAPSPSYWLQITAVFLLPLLYVVFQRNTRLLAIRFIFGRRLYHRLFRIFYLIGSLLTPWVFLTGSVDFLAHDKVTNVTLTQWASDALGIMPLIPMLVLLYFPMFLLCVWVLFKPSSIVGN